MVWLARRWPRTWYVWAERSRSWCCRSPARSLYPVLVEPLFNRFTPMAEGPFKASVLRLAAREGVQVDDVLVADASRRTTTLNAYVSGLGGTRRVVVYDNLVDGLHAGPGALGRRARAGAREAPGRAGGHARSAPWAGWPGSACSRCCSTATGCAAERVPRDRPTRRVAALVLALVAVGGLLASPVPNTVSRAVEARADRDALESTGDDAAFVAMQRRLAIEAIHDPTPPAWSQLWFGSHPTVLQRAGLPASLRRRRVDEPDPVRHQRLPDRGVAGIESFVLALCERMPPDEVVVYTASMPGDREYDATLPFPVHRDPSGMLLPTPAVARRVAKVMRDYDCDRVVFGASAPLGLLAPRLRRAGARRMVALTHGHEVWWARVPVARQLLRRIGDSVDVMTYVSEWCRDRIAPALSPAAAARMRAAVARRRHRPLLPRVRGSGGAPTARDPRRTRRSWSAWRGWSSARARTPWSGPGPRCCARIPDARLLLVGDGPNRTARRAAGRDGCGWRTRWSSPGSVPWEEVPAYMDAGDVFAMPCRTRLLGLEPEAFGIVFLEAAACGLPVVAGSSGGAAEAVADASSVVRRSRRIGWQMQSLGRVPPRR